MERKKIKLTDLVERKVFAETSQGDIEVGKLGLGEIAGIMLSFPGVAKAMSKKDGVSNAERMKHLANDAPEAIPFIIAAGCGMPGDRGRKAARRLSAQDQIIVLLEIFDVSFPEGLNGFLGVIERAADKVAPEVEMPDLEAT